MTRVTQIGSSAESIIHAFDGILASAIREFPILASITRPNISPTVSQTTDLIIYQYAKIMTRCYEIR